ncbi:MAG TPA: T9SS type A sorting domain-containing protein [Chitinophagaceae bacterium]
MEKRNLKDWLAVVMIGTLTFVIVPLFFWWTRQEAVKSDMIKHSAQTGLPITIQQAEYRETQPGQGTSLVLYPNPVKHTLHVVVPRRYASEVWLAIFKPDGQLWKRYAVESGRVIEINVQALPAGDYIVKVGDRQGRTWSAKFLKA